MLHKTITTRFGLQAGYWKLRNIEAWPNRCTIFLELYADKASAEAGMLAIDVMRFDFEGDDVPIDITANNVIALCRNAMRKLDQFSDATDED